MSSPMMKTILGRCGCCAVAGMIPADTAASNASKLSDTRRLIFIVLLLGRITGEVEACAGAPLERKGCRPGSPPLHLMDRVVQGGVSKSRRGRICWPGGGP